MLTNLHLIKLFIVHCGLLVLLVLADQVVHVALCLGELHLVHALAGVPGVMKTVSLLFYALPNTTDGDCNDKIPMEESLPPEHGCELL